MKIYKFYDYFLIQNTFIFYATRPHKKRSADLWGDLQGHAANGFSRGWQIETSACPVNDINRTNQRFSLLGSNNRNQRLIKAAGTNWD